MAEKLLRDDIVRQIQEVFNAQLKEHVQILFFGTKTDCEHCSDTLQLVQEVAAISEKLSVNIYDLEEDADIARQYNVTMAPGLVIGAKDGDQITDYGIRLAGIPSGYEFSSLIQDLILVSNRDSGLDASSRQALQELTQPVLLQVFVTPTWPYCPQAVVLAHRMALESPLVQAEMVEAIEFQELSDRHQVSGVPQTTINDGAGTLIGAAPEGDLLTEIRNAIG